MKCQPCGQDNASSALFCTACRRPLVAPTKLPTRIEPLAQPAMAAAAPATSSSFGGAAEGPSTRNPFAPPNAGRASRMGDDSQVMTQEEAWAAVIGDSSTAYYLERFERQANGGSGGWHWPGFFVTWYWMLYRKMWLPALLYFIASWVSSLVLQGVSRAAPLLGGLLSLGWLVAWLIVPPLMANGWYYGHCLARIRDIRARGGSKEQMLARLEAKGGTSGIAVIIIVVLGLIATIGILAAIALPAYQVYTVKAKVASAIPLGNEVAAAVGRTYEQTGQLPTQADVDGIVLHSANRSKYVNGVDIDGTSGTLTLRLTQMPQGDGMIQFVPSADNNHHLSWTCTAPSDMQRFVPASCRNDAAAH